MRDSAAAGVNQEYAIEERQGVPPPFQIVTYLVGDTVARATPTWESGLEGV